MNLFGTALKRNSHFHRFNPVNTGDFILPELRAGERGIVKALHGGENFRSKMIELGIVPGTKIEIAAGGKGQPLLLKIGDSRLMLGHGMAQKISVSPERMS